MLTTRWRPFNEMQDEMSQLHNEMSRVFDRWGVGTGRPVARNVYPLVSMWEDESNLYVEAELPGFELNDLEIYVNGDNQLSVKGERKRPKLEHAAWHRQERGYGEFNRVLDLPCRVDSERVSAEFHHGVLTITMPKHESVKPRRIEVKTD